MGLLNDVGNATVGQGLGLLFGGLNDRRQYNQQKKLQNLQIAGNKEMLDYSKMKDLEMWNNTNLEAQVGHANAAGGSTTNTQTRQY